jgi:lysophospholipase L1-like esterase
MLHFAINSLYFPLVFFISLGWALNSWASHSLEEKGKVGKEERKLIASAERKGNSSPKSGQIVLIGASYTRGWNIPEIDGMKVINKGVDGNQSFEMLARFRDDVITNKPRAVLIWGFINDIHRSKRDDIQATIVKAKDSIKKMVKMSQAKGIVPVLGTEVTIRGDEKLIENLMGFVGSLLGKESYQDYVNKHVMAVNKWIREFAREEGILLFDFQPVLSDSKGIRKKEFATKDGTHISAEGYEKMTSYLKEKMGKD